MAVLGSLLIDDRLVGQALERIRPEDFLAPKCRMVFQAIRALFAEGKPTDAVTVRSKLGGREDDGWTQYLMELMELTPTASNIWEYASIMRAQARMSKVAELGGLLQVTQDMDKARGYIAQLNELLVDRRGIRRMDMSQMLLAFADRHSGEPVAYMTWGLPKLDAGTYTEMGDMVVLGGYPSAGKTAPGGVHGLPPGQDAPGGVLQPGDQPVQAGRPPDRQPGGDRDAHHQAQRDLGGGVGPICRLL